MSEGQVRQKLRRREWVRASPGVYITHTGPPSWRQRAWAAVLGAQGGALTHQSVLSLAGLIAPMGAIHVAIDRKGFAPKRSGVVVHRYANLASRVAPHRRPPHVRIEHAVLDVTAEAKSELAAIAVIADAVRERVTTPGRLENALSSRQRFRRRELVHGLLQDLREGTCSVLEHRYLVDVERPHGLPRARRQAPTEVGRRGFRDVLYDEIGLVVELDGRIGHDDARSRDADLERDLDAAVYARLESLRLGWGQVVIRPCLTAEKVAAMLTNLGWTGKFVRCPKCATRRSAAL